MLQGRWEVEQLRQRSDWCSVEASTRSMQRHLHRRASRPQQWHGMCIVGAVHLHCCCRQAVMMHGAALHRPWGRSLDAGWK